jgi:preprotein translocase subunit SecD
MRDRRAVSLVLVLIVAFGSLAATFAVGNSPALGLDLQGGASVVLQPPPGTPSGTLDQAIEIIRNRVDALGVAEPEITRQGNAVVVELPGVKDQQRAVDLVGDTAELRFRPVLGVVDQGGAPTTTTTTSTTSTTVPGETTTTTVPATTTTTAPPTVTPRDENEADAEVVLPARQVDDEEPILYRLGPAALLGEALDSASARFSAPQWYVELDLDGPGGEAFDALAAKCVAFDVTCPTNQLAIEIDGEVVSAPTFNSSNFGGTATITGNFSEGEAKDLALVLRYGSLPVQLEQQTVRTVSATLGEDSLRAGLIAGAIGAFLVLAYMIFYYRTLGLVVAAGLTVWAAFQWSVISYLGETQGLALSLAGVTGIVVSIGVTVDSYVVYFERLRDDIRAGRTVRSTVDRSFKRAFRTVLIADTSALIGAVTLYVLTVGAVRGFAFFLGLSTVLDVLVAYFFTRPLVSLLARRKVISRSSFVGATMPEPVVSSR